MSTHLDPTVAATSGPLDLLTQASGPAGVTAFILLAATAAGWALIVVSMRQVQRWRRAHDAFEARVRTDLANADLVAAVAAEFPQAPAAFVISGLAPIEATLEVLDASADMGLVEREQGLSRSLTTLATIGATAPFVGLFGTVYGILTAFTQIGATGSTSLAVVAPAIGEALIVTAVGLFAAIPAVVGYNLISRELDDLQQRTRALVRVWVRARGGAA